MKVKNLNTDERPRERMAEHGVSSLSNSELLAILLRTGSGSKNAMELGRELLTAAENRLNELSAMSLDRMRAIPGIGSGKASSIVAAFELGRRCFAEKSTRQRITGPKDAFELMFPVIGHLDHEECWMVFLNHQNVLVSKERLSVGGMTSTDMDCKIILRKCLEKKASSLLVAHNHPSGVALPSKADVDVTAKLKSALNACGLSLLDHVIIGVGTYYSFNTEELVNTSEI
ncbi:MAG: DNA repair protein RadC [Candidatus Cryptobacteroides sp.]